MDSVERFKKLSHVENETLVKLCRNKFISLEEYMQLTPQEAMIAKTIYRILTPWKLLSNDLRLRYYLEEKEKTKYEHPNIWVSRLEKERRGGGGGGGGGGDKYSIWRAVWLRVNCAHAFIEFKKHEKKLNLFINRHLDMIRYLDSFSDPRDDLIQMMPMYKGLGHSYFDEDRNLITSKVIFHESGVVAPKLPDCFHVMAQIALSGEQIELDFLLGKFLQKCLPFAGARRGLTDLSLDSIRTDPTFWVLFSKVLNVLLKNDKFCSDKERVLSALDLKNSDTDKNCFVIFIAFRLWMIDMCKNQPHYTSSGDIDWVKFEEDTNETAKMIYEQFDPDAKDPFKPARDIFIKHNKNPKNRVYRYQNTNVIHYVYDMMKTLLEKEVFAELNNLRKDLKEYNMRGTVPAYYNGDGRSFLLHCTENIEKMSIEIPNHVKTEILNALIYIPRSEWLTPQALSILRLERFGGLKIESITCILELIGLYYDKTTKSKHFDQVLNRFELWDFEVLVWYFYVLSGLGVVDFDLFQPLTTGHRLVVVGRGREGGAGWAGCAGGVGCAGSAGGAGCAEREEGEVYEGTLSNSPTGARLTNHLVYFTICCKRNRIKTIEDQKNSHINIAFDLSRNIYICDKSNKKLSLSNLDELGFSELDIQRKTNRKQQKDFNSIPCKDNPVFCIALDGFVLIYNKTTKYVHCPKCGNFHKFSRYGYVRDEYMCPTCKFNEEQENLYITCHVCNNPNPEKTKVIIEPLDINGIMNVYQHCYFCKKHFE